jgi:hypothetical protein
MPRVQRTPPQRFSSRHCAPRRPSAPTWLRMPHYLAHKTVRADGDERVAVANVERHTRWPGARRSRRCLGLDLALACVRAVAVTSATVPPKKGFDGRPLSVSCTTCRMGRANAARARARTCIKQRTDAPNAPPVLPLPVSAATITSPPVHRVGHAACDGATRAPPRMSGIASSCTSVGRLPATHQAGAT